MIINHNMSSIYANRQLSVVDSNLQSNIEKLSSGMRITRGGDDPSGLAVSEKMRSQIRGLNQANRNTLDGVSFLQATEGYLEETTNILQRIRQLSVQAANGIYSDEDRLMLQVEVSQLIDEVDRIASHAQFNGMNLLLGDFAQSDAATKEMAIHFGANAYQNERIYIGTMTSAALNLIDGEGNLGSLASIEDANKLIGTVDAALKKVTKQRVDLGAYQNRLEETSRGIGVAAENMQAAESRIRDLDMASEITDYVKNSILANSTTAMLSQANLRTQNILQLL
ncbi:MAG: flagellin [Spirochaetia bacterium]|nr:flagellin [Spirochaetia bacterium]